MFSLKKFLKFSFCIVLSLLILDFFLYHISKYKISEITSKHQLNDKISWENETQIAIDAKREGPGEQGLPVTLTDPIEIRDNQKTFAVEGFYVFVSDKISLARALPDKRPKQCKNKKYLRKLPNVSVIITFHNEVWSVLLRCIHSIYNRSPPELLHEIILINDASTFAELRFNLSTYIDEHFDGKVKIHNNKVREGLIRARMIGARLAEAEVIIFLDSHMEVANIWLPPLLEPLVYHPTYATVPIVDGMHHKTFEYEYIGDGYRGTFDWNLRYQWLPLRPQDKPFLGENYELSSMTGGAYAIRREHFFYLGGYDEQLKIWNGENFELSFKLWLCSGGILQVPCSRIVHLSKIHSAYRTTSDGSDFIGYNLKRIVEVWFDDYKKYFYRGDAERYAKIDVGDLSKQFELKRKLGCKPFKYFLDNIATEMLERYPLKPQYFATGSIQSLATKTCIGLPILQYHINPILVNCNENLEKPFKGSDYILTMEKSIKINDTNDQCLDANQMILDNCNHQGYYQHWIYRIDTQQIYNPYSKKCLTGGEINEKIFTAPCDSETIYQKWIWAKYNMTALENWNKTGIIWPEQ